MSYTILCSHWWPITDSILVRSFPDACVGVVAVETFAPNKEWKAYIGIGHGNQEFDEQRIAAFGEGLQPKEAHGIFPQLDIACYKDAMDRKEQPVETQTNEI